MVAIFRTILGLVVVIPVAVFCGLNIHSVSVTYSPFHDSVDVPLYVVGLAFALFGVLFGSFSTWLNSATVRKERRVFKKRIKTLEKELEQLHKMEESKEKLLIAEAEK